MLPLIDLVQGIDLLTQGQLTLIVAIGPLCNQETWVSGLNILVTLKHIVKPRNMDQGPGPWHTLQWESPDSHPILKFEYRLVSLLGFTSKTSNQSLYIDYTTLNNNTLPYLLTLLYMLSSYHAILLHQYTVSHPLRYTDHQFSYLMVKTGINLQYELRHLHCIIL